MCLVCRCSSVSTSIDTLVAPTQPTRPHKSALAMSFLFDGRHSVRDSWNGSEEFWVPLINDFLLAGGGEHQELKVFCTNLALLEATVIENEPLFEFLRGTSDDEDAVGGDLEQVVSHPKKADLSELTLRGMRETVGARFWRDCVCGKYFDKFFEIWSACRESPSLYLCLHRTFHIVFILCLKRVSGVSERTNTNGQVS